MNLAAVAPTLDKLIKGNLLGSLGSALQIFGNPDGTKDDLESHLSTATPEQIASIKQLNNDLERTLFEDRKSARDMQIQTRSKLVPTLALIIVSSTIGMVTGLFFIKVPPDNKDILYMTLGILLSEAKTVFQFYFGSSQGSSAKNEMLAKIAGIK